jgi:ribose 5-phosphate isomerase B
VRVYLGSDHAGYELRRHIVEVVVKLGHDTVDCGAIEYDPGDDYPPVCFEVAARVVADPGSLGVVIGGSGNGEQIAANKVVGCRAALAWSEETARLARQHNDANVVAIGARMHTPDEAAHLASVFLATPFSNDPRHIRRIGLLTAYESAR